MITPSAPLQRQDHGLSLGVDIGGTNVRLGVFDGLQCIHQQRFQADFSQLCHHYPAAQAQQQISQILIQALQALLQRYPQVQHIGIGFPGFIQPAGTSHPAGRILQSPNLPGLHNVDLLPILQQALQRPVLIENDALCAAWAAHQLGRATEPSSLLYIGLGTGIGGGLIIHDQAYAGDHGFAMEFGHLIVEPDGRPCGCGNRGCVEQYASALGIQQNYGGEQSTPAIAALAHAGDTQAIQAFATAGRYLARALAHAAKLLDVHQIVLGGGVMQSQDLIMPALLEELDAALIPVLRGRLAIRIAADDDSAGMLGASLLARTRLAI